MEKKLYKKYFCNRVYLLAKTFNCCNYLLFALRLFRPYIIIKSLIILPLTGDILSATFYLGGAMFTGLMYGIDVRLRKPGYPRWFYRPLINIISTFIFTW